MIFKHLVQFNSLLVFKCQRDLHFFPENNERFKHKMIYFAHYHFHPVIIWDTRYTVSTSLMKIAWCDVAGHGPVGHLLCDGRLQPGEHDLQHCPGVDASLHLRNWLRGGNSWLGIEDWGIIFKVSASAPNGLQHCPGVDAPLHLCHGLRGWNSWHGARIEG